MDRSERRREGTKRPVKRERMERNGEESTGTVDNGTKTTGLAGKAECIWRG
jgi:hypothetical protein